MNRLLRSPRFWLALLVGCALIGLAEAAQFYAGNQARASGVTWIRAVTATMPSWYVLAALVPCVAWLATRFSFEPGRRWQSLAVHVPASFAFGVIHLAVTSWLSDFVLYPGTFPLGYLENLSRLFSIYFVSLEMAYYWALVGVTFAVDFRAKYREREREAAELALRASRLEGSLSRANLEALRMQLNPHFLFNALNTISVLAMKGERQAVVRMLARLSDLLRLALDNTRMIVTLAEELEFLEPYIEIETARFPDRLSLIRRIEPDTLEAMVPSLLLQPLVENAVRHGIARTPGPGEIEIRVQRTGADLDLSVRDTGPGFDEEGPPAEGLGLANTRARLEQLYGPDAVLSIERPVRGGALVRVRIPFRSSAAPSATAYDLEAQTA